MTVLLLGGTAEARELAAALTAAGVATVSSLAGRVSAPRLPVGEVRIGGFGGVDGLASALRDGGFSHLIDATHPFAVGMRAHAVEAAARVGVPVLRLARPGWADHPDAAAWHWVDDYPAARAAADDLGRRPFLTTGRQTLPFFLDWSRSVLARVVEALDVATPPGWTVILDRGPYTVDGERHLMCAHRVDVLLTKDSGGRYTAAKLEAARDLGLSVVVVRRPSAPAGMPEVSSVAEVVGWLGLPERA